MALLSENHLLKLRNFLKSVFFCEEYGQVIHENTIFYGKWLENGMICSFTVPVRFFSSQADIILNVYIRL